LAFDANWDGAGQKVRSPAFLSLAGMMKNCLKSELRLVVGEARSEIYGWWLARLAV
jgi:hypothetical protein